VHVRNAIILSTSERPLAGGKLKATANTVTQGVSARHGDALLATVLVAARLLVWRETWGERWSRYAAASWAWATCTRLFFAAIWTCLGVGTH